MRNDGKKGLRMLMRKSLCMIVPVLLAPLSCAMDTGTASLKTVFNLVKHLPGPVQHVCLSAAARLAANKVEKGDDEWLFNLCESLRSEALIAKFENIVQGSIAITESKKSCPTIVAHDANRAFYDGYCAEGKQYFATLSDSQKLPISITVESFTLPCISEDGRDMIGWSDDLDKSLLHINTITGKIAIPLHYSEYHRHGWLHYAFLSDGSLMMRDNKRLYIADVPSFLKLGKRSLCTVFKRGDDEYPFSTTINGIEVLSSSHVICVGPHEKSFEVMHKRGSLWERKASIKIPNKIRGYVVAKEGQILCVSENTEDDRLLFFDLQEDNEQMAVVDVPGVKTVSGHFVAAFSPDEALLICRTKKRGEIVFVNCVDPAEPFVMSTVNISPNMLISRIVSNAFGTCVQDDDGKRYNINLNPALPYLAAYKKKKLEEAHKKTSTLSNNNNA